MNPTVLRIIEIGISVFLGCILGWIITSFYFKKALIPRGVIRLAYDPDDPGHPAMGLMLESMDYILNHNTMIVAIEKKNFPEDSRKKQSL